MLVRGGVEGGGRGVRGEGGGRGDGKERGTGRMGEGEKGKWDYGEGSAF